MSLEQIRSRLFGPRSIGPGHRLTHEQEQSNTRVLFDYLQASNVACELARDPMIDFAGEPEDSKVVKLGPFTLAGAQFGFCSFIADEGLEGPLAAKLQSVGDALDCDHVSFERAVEVAKLVAEALAK